MNAKKTVAKTVNTVANETKSLYVTRSAEDKVQLERLATFIKAHCVGKETLIPTANDCITLMREAYKLGVVLPKALRTYVRPDGDFGVISAKADLFDQSKLSRSLAFRKRYPVSHADELFESFYVHDYQQKNAATGVWEAPTWTSTPAQRKASTIRWVLAQEAVADDVQAMFA
jgi:hypothetical protein